jgi:hypothetical protein
MCITHPCQKGFLQRKNRARYLSGPDRVYAKVCLLALHEIQLGGSVYSLSWVNEYANADGHKKKPHPFGVQPLLFTIHCLLSIPSIISHHLIGILYKYSTRI